MDYILRKSEGTRVDTINKHQSVFNSCANVQSITRFVEHYIHGRHSENGVEWGVGGGPHYPLKVQAHLPRDQKLATQSGVGAGLENECYCNFETAEKHE